MIERWNFKYSPNDSSTHLHIPKKIIFPIKQGIINNIKINIPYNIDACCRYLYGDNYNIPLKKGSDYITKIIDNKPTTILNNNSINSKNINLKLKIKKISNLIKDIKKIN